MNLFEKREQSAKRATNPKGEAVEMMKDGILYLVRLSGPQGDVKCITHSVLIADYLFQCLAKRD